MRTLIFILSLMSFAYSQNPPIEPGVSHDLAKWRAAHYSDVRYKLNLTVEKMSPVLKGTIEIRVTVATQSVPPASAGGAAPVADPTPIILDWRPIKGHVDKSSLPNVSINGKPVRVGPPSGFVRRDDEYFYDEVAEHLVFKNGVVPGENVIKLDFTSPILPSGSAITRYIDKEDGSEYIYSLFVPSDASSAFPVFDQPDLKAKFTLFVSRPPDWSVVSNTSRSGGLTLTSGGAKPVDWFEETKPISTYVFAFAAGPWQQVSVPPAVAGGAPVDVSQKPRNVKRELKEAYRKWLNTDVSMPMTKAEAEAFRNPPATAGGTDKNADLSTSIYVRKSQLEKFKPHAAEVFRLNREGIKFLETYFDYKFPFPKYDIVLIPEFPFGGMEHAGATFLRESAVIFPQEPTKNDHISRANLIFHEAAHQWFGDTVTMKWFDDLWLKEGFAEFMAYKTLEKVMPECNAWKVFYERNKQAAYLTDSTKGTTPIYQEIANLSAAKSAYGNIVYRKAPSFLKQAEFYIGPDKFQTAVRSFLKKHEFANAGWEDLVTEFEDVTFASRISGWTYFPKMSKVEQEKFENSFREKVRKFAKYWVMRRGLPLIRGNARESHLVFEQENLLGEDTVWDMAFKFVEKGRDGIFATEVSNFDKSIQITASHHRFDSSPFIFPNYQDYGYGIFLLDDKSRDYILKNIQDEKDDFLRSMMWGALWDSVREGELDPKEYVALATRNLPAERDETITASVLNRVATAITYYLDDNARVALTRPFEQMLEREMSNGATLGRRITFYRGLINVGVSMRAREVYKQILQGKFWPKPSIMGGLVVGETRDVPIKTKDRFDIVTKLASLNDPDAPKLLAALEKTETTDDAKRYAYAARAAFPTKETKEKYWNDFTTNKDISESWIEAAFGPFNSVRHADLTLPYLERGLKELPNHKRNRKIFFVNGWLAAFIGGQRSEEALTIVNKFLADNPNLDRDLRLKILENVDLIERAVKIRAKFATR